MWTIAILLIVLSMGALVYLTLPTSTWRGIATIVYLLLISCAFAGGIELLGRSKPTMLEWRKLAGSQIAGLWVVEDVAIYVMLVKDSDAPRLYVFPYSAQDAEDLQDSARLAEQEEGTAEAGEGMDGVEGGAFTDDHPPPPLPPKQ